MSSKKHKRCKESCHHEREEEVFCPEKKAVSKVTQSPFLLFLILVLLIIIFSKDEIISSIKMLFAGFRTEEEVVC